MNRRVSVALAGTALVALPAGSVWASAAHVVTKSGATSHVASKTSAKTKVYKGPVVDMRWGPVQAQITVKGKKIIAAKLIVSPETQRSKFIDDQAGPLLKQETLHAQNPTIDLVSGATMTSEAYAQSLQGAMLKAKLVKPTG